MREKLKRWHQSHPSRGAWIEIGDDRHVRDVRRRTPHGVRGLKFQLGPVGLEFVESHPSRGAWIEIKSPVAAA